MEVKYEQENGKESKKRILVHWCNYHIFDNSIPISLDDSYIL